MNLNLNIHLCRWSTAVLPSNQGGQADYTVAE